MAFLINRVPASRFECLHSLVQMLYHNFGTNSTFTILDAKYEPGEYNVKSYCSLLEKFGDELSYCPYLDNPLDPKGCNLTNGRTADSTKSKEVSNTINALHALGFIKRTGRTLKVTDSGELFAKTKYGTKEMQDIIHLAVTNYGPVVGVMAQITQLCQDGISFSTKDICVGYPNTEEFVNFNGRMIKISSGSTDDSNTRTKSCIITWLTTAGYIRPTSWPKLNNGEYAHYTYRNKLNSGHRGESQYILVEPINFELWKHTTLCPLDYTNMTKLTAALRENDIADVRLATMNNESRIQNRRFAICYFLNYAFDHHRYLDINHLKELFRKYPDYFIVSDSNIEEVIESELGIANMAGIPYKIVEVEGTIKIYPLTGLNTKEMSSVIQQNSKLRVDKLVHILRNELK